MDAGGKTTASMLAVIRRHNSQGIGGGMPKSSFIAARVLGAGLLTAMLLAPVSLADNAPGYETPEGLAIGVPNPTVRMAAEQVDVKVVERGSAAVALVTATFDMSNDGPTVQLLTGFPNVYTVEDGFDCCYLSFAPAGISNFRAWTDAEAFTPANQKIRAGPFKDQEWFVWNMSYPRGTTLPVHVSYAQKLGEQSNDDGRPIEWTPVIYVLRTGALWAGTIGHAHVTFEAVDGGTFIGADGAQTASGDHIDWDLTDFKPTSDVGTAYIFATPWKELQAAEAAVNQPDANPTEFLRAAQNAIFLVGTGRGGGAHKWLEDRYGSSMYQWASNAQVLDSADSWRAIGDADIFAEAAQWRFGLRCWPAAAVGAYQRAADLGSEYGSDQLANLHAGGAYGLRPGLTDGSQLPVCDPHDVAGAYPISVQSPVTIDMRPSTGNTSTSQSTPDVPNSLSDTVRADILAAVDRANAAWSAATQALDPSGLYGNVAGTELNSDLSELDQLRKNGQTRRNINTAFNVTDVTLDGAGHATVHTVETWDAEISNTSGQLVQRTPPATYSETYTLEFSNGSWIVTENDLQ